MTLSQIGKQNHISIQNLHLRIKQSLEETPPSLSIPQFKTPYAYLAIDGLWFKKEFCLLVYKQTNYSPILHYSFSKREWGYQIAKDLKETKDKGYRFSGFVSDGATGIIKGVLKIHPRSIHQICLAHIHRKLISNLGKYSQDLRIIKLRRLADHLWLIESKEALTWWKKQVDKWVSQNFSYLREKRTDDIGRSWFVHTKARKAVSLLRSVPNTSFKFLDHYQIPKTNNGLEGVFSVIRRKWRSHPGLSKKRWKQFLSWYIYFYNQEKLS